MDSEKSGQFLSSKDSRDRQRQTAVDIARKKVLAAYNSNAKNTEKSASITRNFSSSAVQPRVQAQTQAQSQAQSQSQTQAQSQSSAQQQSQPSSTNLSTPTSMASYKQTPIATNVTEKRDTKAEWQKYHSAWQNYYQKYYSEYYATAARNYVAKEKLKAHRAAEDERKRIELLKIEEFPIENKMEKVVDMLKARPWILLDDIFVGETKKRGIITCFMAVLELMKIKKLLARQDEQDGQIRIYLNPDNQDKDFRELMHGDAAA